MDLIFKRFAQEYYQEYASWFSDPVLNEQLGPMDQDWLDAILSEKAEEGETWAIFLEQEMVGVIEIVFDPEGKFPPGITAIAVKLSRRRQGIARRILAYILADHASKGLHEHIAFIKETNHASRCLVENLGFHPTTGPDHNRFITYQR